MVSKKQKEAGFQTFSGDLKADRIGAVVLMYGVEQYLVKWAVDAIRKKYVQPATEAMDYAVLDGTAASPAEIVSACETFPMLSEKRVVWVKNMTPLKNLKSVAGYGEDGVDQILKYIKDPNPGAIVVFSNEETDGRSKLVKALKKQGSCYEFGKLTDTELISFARKRFRSARVEISQADLHFLVEATGYRNNESEYRLFHFENDIRKLIAYGGDRVSREDIQSTISGDGDTFIFNLIDGISGNDKTKALEILYNKMKEDAYGAIPIAAAIISQVELMLSIREFMDSDRGLRSPAAISKYTGVHEFRVKKAMNYVRRYSLAEMRSMMLSAYEAYMDIIPGVMSPQLALEMFIARIGA